MQLHDMGTIFDTSRREWERLICLFEWMNGNWKAWAVWSFGTHFKSMSTTNNQCQLRVLSALSLSLYV